MGDRREFHRLVSVDAVESEISRYYPLRPIGIERVSIWEAYGRVIGEDIYSPIDHPPFDRSEVDGYAVRSIDVAGADDLHPVRLRIIGSISVGEKPRVEVVEGTAVEIATGAMIPRGADTVVMVEYTRRINNNEILVYRAPVPGEHIAVAGSDINAGDLVLSRGSMIGEKEIGLLAGIGLDTIPVYKKPRIAVYSTGNEVVEPGKELRPGKVYNVNGHLVTALLNRIGAKAEYLGLLPDNYSAVKEALGKALEEYDIVVTSGGTSAGLGDLVYRVFDEIGDPGVIIHGLKVKPGKPTVFAVANGKLLVGLPGFPLSCYMVANNVLKPIIAKITGYREPESRRIRARMPYQLRKPMGKTWFVPVALVETREGFTAYPVSLRSGSISPLAYADGYMILPENRDLVIENEIVEVELFIDRGRIPGLNIIGSNDYLLNKLIEHLGLSGAVRVISVGSTGGWRAIRRGEADIAPTHLLDPETGKYNEPFLKKFGLEDRALLIRGYMRRIGIVVRPGNPKNIRSIKDFLRSDVVIVNRTKGSGIRVYLDSELKRIAAEEGVGFEKLVGRINGYFYEAKTHTAVALAVRDGRADAGIAAEIAAHIYGMEFIPLTWEHYDFLVLKERMGKKEVESFINGLRSGETRRFIDSFPGYKSLHDTGEPI